jgi:hypothetical protein
MSMWYSHAVTASWTKEKSAIEDWAAMLTALALLVLLLRMTLIAQEVRINS